MEVLCAALLTIMFNLHISEGTNRTITWKILSSPIVFGKDAKLYCNASLVENCCTNTATWMKDFDVIVHHGASTNKSKYIQTQGIDGFSLTIKNFNEEDINHQYTCLYDFFSYSAVLKMDKTNFKYMPRSNEIKVSINNKTIDKMILADVMFENVYPAPECILVVNEKKIQTNVTVADKTQTGLFWKMRVHLVSEVHQIKCINTIAVNCTVGKDEIDIEKKKFDCQDRITTFGSDENILDITLAAILSSSFVILCVAVIVGLLILKKLQCTKRKESRSEGDEIHSMSLLDNDSEQSPLIQNSLGKDISSISSKNDCAPGDIDENYSGDEIHSMSLLDNDSEQSPLIQNSLGKDISSISSKNDCAPGDIDENYLGKEIDSTSLKDNDSERYPRIQNSSGQSKIIQITVVPAQKKRDVIDILKYSGYNTVQQQNGR